MKVITQPRLEWEDVEDTSSNGYMARARVPGGYLVLYRETDPRVAALTFVPDQPLDQARTEANRELDGKCAW